MISRKSNRYQAVPLHHDTTTVDLTLRPQTIQQAPAFTPPPPPAATQESIEILKQFQNIFTENESAKQKGPSGSKFQESVVI